jgi:hypothetical protein
VQPSYECRYSFRRPGVLVVALFSGGLGLFLAGAAWRHSNGGGLLALLPLGLSALMFRRWIGRHTIESRIDERGITIWGKFWPWDRVARVSGVREHDFAGVMLFFQAKGVGVDRRLWTDRPLTEAEYSALMERLRKDLGPLQPHLRLD